MLAYWQSWWRAWRCEAGQDLVEYSLLIALVVLVVISVVGTLGQYLYQLFGDFVPLF